jgi:hypothetical protein
MPISKRKKMLVVVIVLGSVCALFTVFVIRGMVSMQVENVPVPALKDISLPVWAKLSRQRMYFGHQSVGNNIIDGLQDILKEHPEMNLNIIETSDPQRLHTPALAHSKVGTNKDPKSKLDAFADLMAKGMADNVDIAFFKFCYVDVREGTNAEEVFADYRETMSRLKAESPDTVFAHVTVPLCSVQAGPKAWIKRVIGKSVDGYDDNIIRHQFNEMLRNEYEDREPIFDLAKIQATSLMGEMYLYKWNGSHFRTMLSDYTYDGGHLNEIGRRRVAEQFLIFLAGMVK